MSCLVRLVRGSSEIFEELSEADQVDVAVGVAVRAASDSLNRRRRAGYFGRRFVSRSIALRVSGLTWCSMPSTS